MRLYKRKEIWYLDITIQGRRIRKAVGKSKIDAQKALDVAKGKILSGTFDIREFEPSITFNELKDMSLSIRNLTPIKPPPRYEDVVIAKVRPYQDESRQSMINSFFTPFRMKLAFSICVSLFLIFIITLTVQFSPFKLKNGITDQATFAKKSQTDSPKPENTITQQSSPPSFTFDRKSRDRRNQWQRFTRNPFVLSTKM